MTDEGKADDPFLHILLGQCLARFGITPFALAQRKGQRKVSWGLSLDETIQI